MPEKHKHNHNQFSFSTNLFKLSALYLLSLSVYERQVDLISSTLIEKKYFAQERVFTMGKYFMGVLMTFVAQYILVYFKSIKAFCMMAILIYSPVFLFEEWVLDLPDATDDNFNNVLTYCAAMAVLAGFGVSALFLGIFTYAGLSTDSYHCGKAYGLLQTVLLVGILNFKENVSSEWKGWEYFSGAIITSLLILVTLDSPEKELQNELKIIKSPNGNIFKNMKYYLYLMPTCLVVSFAGRVWVIIEFFAKDEDINITPNDENDVIWYLKYLLGGFSALIFGQFFDGGKKLESIWGVKLLFILGSVLAALGYEIAADRLVILGAILLGFGTMALFSLMLSFFYFACTNTLSSLQCNSLTGAISSFLMYYYYGALLWHLCYVGCGGNEYFTLGTGILITVISVVTLGKFNYHHKLEGNL